MLEITLILGILAGRKWIDMRLDVKLVNYRSMIIKSIIGK